MLQTKKYYKYAIAELLGALTNHRESQKNKHSHEGGVVAPDQFVDFAGNGDNEYEDNRGDYCEEY